VFGDQFGQLDEKARSGELTAISCIYAEIAGVVHEPCDVEITNVEGTIL